MFFLCEDECGRNVVVKCGSELHVQIWCIKWQIIRKLEEPLPNVPLFELTRERLKEVVNASLNEPDDSYLPW